jgi:hypothetical protein
LWMVVVFFFMETLALLINRATYDIRLKAGHQERRWLIHPTTRSFYSASMLSIY